MSFSLAGKTAIITGAANGVGLAIARHFVREGVQVMMADMNEEKLITEISALTSDETKPKFFAGDLRQRLTQANLISATIDEFERIDILVNASRQVLHSNPLDPDEDEFENLMEQNVVTALRLTQLVAKRMMKQAEDEPGDNASIGNIVNLSSIVGRRAHPDLMAFSISSAALDQMTRAMAVALAEHRIRVNAVAIGSVMSASLRNALKDNVELRGLVAKATPLGYIGEAAEVVEAVQYLASEASSFVTGQILTVDGGRTLIDPVSVAAH
ncbi:MAG: SDR family oxidoreductase [Rhodobacteraceae bacterium]|nr:SDR family oxidoreductase [Paracoccaceae bacterium]